jgi:hypothetical protein
MQFFALVSPAPELAGALAGPGTGFLMTYGGAVITKCVSFLLHALLPICMTITKLMAQESATTVFDSVVLPFPILLECPLNVPQPVARHPVQRTTDQCIWVPVTGSCLCIHHGNGV